MQVPGSESTAAAVTGFAEFASCCRWVADAYDTGDQQQIAPALGAMYHLLVSSGWTASERGAALLRLHAAVLDAELVHMVHEPVPRPR